MTAIRFRSTYWASPYDPKERILKPALSAGRAIHPACLTIRSERADTETPAPYRGMRPPVASPYDPKERILKRYRGGWKSRPAHASPYDPKERILKHYSRTRRRSAADASPYDPKERILKQSNGGVDVHRESCLTIRSERADTETTSLANACSDATCLTIRSERPHTETSGPCSNISVPVAPHHTIRKSGY